VELLTLALPPDLRSLQVDGSGQTAPTVRWLASQAKAQHPRA